MTIKNLKNNYLNTYVNFLKKFLKPIRPLKIIFDCSNGATGLVLKKLLQTTNYPPKARLVKDGKLQTSLINNKPDGNFPGHGPNPWANGATSQLQKEVLTQKADLGIIFDADGDRVFFIDNLGRVVEPDIIAPFDSAFKAKKNNRRHSNRLVNKKIKSWKFPTYWQAGKIENFPSGAFLH